MKASLIWFSMLSLTLGALSITACGGRNEDDEESKAAAGGKSSASAGSSSLGSSARGGAGSSSLVSSGGSSSGGSSAVASSPHLTECQSICSRTVDAGCDVGGSQCATLCSVITGLQGCQSQINDWLNCVKTAEVTCDSAGEPAFSGCDGYQLSAMGCALTQEPPAPVKSSCSSYCDAVEKAGCSSDTGEEELGCEQACGLAGTLISTCQDVYVAYMDCQGKSTITCAPDGSPAVEGCDSQELAFMGCMLTQLGANTTASSGQ